MNVRRRNLLVLLLVLGLLFGSIAVIASNQTRLGLDLKGGVELVYEGRPTPQVPKVTPQAVDDAISTIRKRTDALGVSEPEIQRAGADQISIGLPGTISSAATTTSATTRPMIARFRLRLVTQASRPGGALHHRGVSTSRRPPSSS